MSSLATQARDLRARGGLSREEVASLARRAATGDSRAAETLVASVYLLLVRDARRVAAVSGDEVDDLVQEACMGAMHAAKLFNPERGASFATYATYWASARVQKRSVSDRRMVKIGTTTAQRKVVFGVGKAVRELEASGRDPSDAAVAEYLSVLEVAVSETRRRMDSHDVSIDEARVGARLLTETLAADEPAADELLDVRRRQVWVEQLLRDVAQQLTRQEEDVLVDNLLADEPKTLAEIATWHGVSRARMSSVKQRLVKKLRRRLVPVEEVSE